MNGLYLKDNHLIAAGQKTAIAAVQPTLTPGRKELIVKDKNGYCVVGRVELSAPQAVSSAEFDARTKEHQVSRRQRLQWWPDAETLHLYPVKFTPYTQRLAIDMAPGALAEVELAGQGLKEVATVDGWHIYEVE